MRIASSRFATRPTSPRRRRPNERLHVIAEQRPCWHIEIHLVRTIVALPRNRRLVLLRQPTRTLRVDRAAAEWIECTLSDEDLDVGIGVDRLGGRRHRSDFRNPEHPRFRKVLLRLF